MVINRGWLDVRHCSAAPTVATVEDAIEHLRQGRITYILAEQLDALRKAWETAQ
jgi:hypothetical protein